MGYYYKPGQNVGALQVNTAATAEAALLYPIAAAAGLQSKYFLFSSISADYYGWFNLDGAGVDPAVAGRTGVVIAITTGQTKAQVATAVAAAVGAATGVDASVDGSNNVLIKAEAVGAAKDTLPGNSGLVVERIRQGRAAGFLASGAVSALAYDATEADQI